MFRLFHAVEIEGMWEGRYEYDESFQLSGASFNMKLISSFWGKISGWSKDVGENAIPDKALITGHLRGKDIRFEKFQPVLYYHNSTKSKKLRKISAASSTIQYQGSFNKIKSVFEGTWRIEAHNVTQLEGQSLDFPACFGRWEMRKVTQ